VQYVLIAGSIVLVSFVIFGVMSLGGVGLDHVVPGAPFRLAEETVDITLSADRVSVSAAYVFRNDDNREKTLKLAYPFGEGRGVGGAEHITVTDGAGKEIMFGWKKRELTFTVVAPAEAETTVKVEYEQPVTGTVFKYVWGKDRFWGLGGAFTTVTVTAPAAFGEISASYPLENVPGPEDGVGYVFVRDDFYPQMNFTLKWKRPPREEP